MNRDRRDVIKAIGAPLLLAGLDAVADIRTAVAAPGHKTSVSIQGNAFLINGRPTYPGRSYNGKKIEGLLFTSRMANAIIDDHNPETRGVWAYADGPWDPERNTNEFIANLPRYRQRSDIDRAQCSGRKPHRLWLASAVAHQRLHAGRRVEIGRAHV